jgi:hypothetical protein
VQDEWEDFLTIPAYDLILSNNVKQICEEEYSETNKETGSSIFINLEEEWRDKAVS